MGCCHLSQHWLFYWNLNGFVGNVCLESNPVASCHPTARVSYFLKWVISCHIDSNSICPQMLFHYRHPPLTSPAACSFTALCCGKKRTCHMSEIAHTCLLMMLAKENKQIMTNWGSLIYISTAWHKNHLHRTLGTEIFVLILWKIALDKTCCAFFAHL